MRYLTPEEETWIRSSKRVVFLWNLFDKMAWVALASMIATVILILWHGADVGPRVVMASSISSVALIVATTAERLVYRWGQKLGPPPGGWKS